MALYMAQFAYTAEALATMAKNPQDRSVPSRELIEKSGGRLISFYFCFGEYDGVAIYEAPDDRHRSKAAAKSSSERECRGRSPLLGRGVSPLFLLLFGWGGEKDFAIALDISPQGLFLQEGCAIL